MASTSQTVTATAGVNIALVKYWGKADSAANLPAVGSISLTLNTLRTETTVGFSKNERDSFILDGEAREDERVFKTLDEIRARSGCSQQFQVRSTNYVPTASGLASSASGAAALVAATWSLCTDSQDLFPVLDIIRKGSGSAPRSVMGGLVELNKDSGHISQISSPERWPLSMIVIQLSDGPKSTSSREGMRLTQETSPYYQAWVDAHPTDLAHARTAIERKDLEALGMVMERSTMRMHACMLAADPPLIYWNERTLAVVSEVLALRKNGIGAWYTMDAGPHVKILCEPKNAQSIYDRLKDLPFSARLTLDTMGSGIEIAR